jgi:hypothetical protein
MGKTASGGLARCRDDEPLRFLAVLAQHGGCRCRPLPEALHHHADGRDRAAAALGGSEINEAKKVLATEITALLHGRDAAELAAETARKTFEEGALAETLPTVRCRPPRSRRGSACSRCSCGRAGRLQRRGAAPRQGRRGARQRRPRRGRPAHRVERGHDGRRRDQALPRPQEARSRAAGVSRFN